MQQQQTEFTPIQRVALGKVVSERSWKAARALVKAGEHAVDFKVHVQGDVVVLEDGEAIPTHKMPWILALACAVRRSGIQSEGIVKVMQEILVEAIAMQESKDDADTKEMAEFKEYAAKAVKAVRKSLEALPKTVRKGQVRVGALSAFRDH